ncbi:hypothetical protein JCM11641_000386 [Rhodosporidiobolus odoratus]
MTAGCQFTDLRAAEEQQAAEQLQLESAIQNSVSLASGGSCVPSNSSSSFEDNDEVLALRRQLDVLHVRLSRAAIPSIAAQDRHVISDRIRAREVQREWDEERGEIAVDAELTRAVEQGEDDEGEYGAMDLRGQEEVERIMASTSHTAHLSQVEPLSPSLEEREQAILAQDKGKAPALPLCLHDTHVGSLNMTAPVFQASDPSTCSICLERCLPVTDPYTVSLEASASGAVPHGMYFGDRKDKHIACLTCAAEYVQHKLNEPGSRAFPIGCPEAQCDYSLTDLDAARIFGEANLERWHYRKLLDSQEQLFCPNARCSARLSRTEGEGPQAECPACHAMLCMNCKVP